MAKVWFRCDRKWERMFVLNSLKEMNYIPLVGDEIETTTKDFMKATFRVKPWSKDKEYAIINNNVYLNFIVVKRKYSTGLDEWELICQPTAESLLYLLQSIKVRK